MRKEFLYDAVDFTLANGASVDFHAYEYLSVVITTAGSSLTLAERNSPSFGLLQNRQVLGDGEAEIGNVRLKNTSGAPVSGTLVTSSRRISWGDKINVDTSVPLSVTLNNVTAEGNNVDGDAVKTSGVLCTEAYQMQYNGATWDRARGDVGGTWVQGRIADGSAHGAISGHKPVLIGGTDGTNAQMFATDGNGYLKIIVGTGSLSVSGTATASNAAGTAANDAAASGNPVQIGGVVRTDNPTSLVNGDMASMLCSTSRAQVALLYQIPENTWSYAAAAGGIANTTTGVTAKAAAAAGLRNYVTGCSLSWDALTNATEFVINDGAAGTVLFRHKIVNGLAGREDVEFPVPLRGTAATLLEIKTLTASGAGGVFANLNGYVAP